MTAPTTPHHTDMPAEPTLVPPGARTEAEFIAQCEADYMSAEITTVAHSSSGKPPFTHLLAVVELLHGGLEANPLIGLGPHAGGYPRRCDLGKRGGKLFVQRWSVEVRAGLTWYRQCKEGTMLVPGTPTPVQLGQLASDPPWPHLVVEDENFWLYSEFWGNRPGNSRWHRMLSSTPVDITPGWDLDEFGKAREWLSSEVHIDLFSRSVLLGSCHLRLPNPIYRKLDGRIGDDGRSITFDLTPYPNKDHEELELTFWNRRAWGATEVRRMPLRAGENLLHVPDGVEQVAYAVTSPTRGLLAQSDLYIFISSIQGELSFATERRRVRGAPKADGTTSQNYTVDVSGHEQVISVGEPRATEALSRLSADEAEQRVGKAWSQLALQWFDENAMAGTQAIRNIIGTARKRIDILDPYFGRIDLRSFALATTRHGLPVRVLTSASFCTTEDTGLGIENGDALQQELASVQAQDPRFAIEIKVMAGAKSPVHDRFLIVDDAVWVLGASLNEFGSRGTLLWRLPPPSVRGPGGALAFSFTKDVFDAHWSRAEELSTPLEKWVARRRLLRARPPARTAPKSVANRFRETRALAIDALRRIGEVWRA